MSLRPREPLQSYGRVHTGAVVHVDRSHMAYAPGLLNGYQQLQAATEVKRAREDDVDADALKEREAWWKKLKAAVEDRSTAFEDDELIELLVPYLAHACSPKGEPKLLAGLCNANKQLAALCNNQKDVWKRVLEYQIENRLPWGRTGEMHADENSLGLIKTFPAANWREAVLRRCNRKYWDSVDKGITDILLNIASLVGVDAATPAVDEYIKWGAIPYPDTLARRLTNILDRRRKAMRRFVYQDGGTPSAFALSDQENSNKDMEEAAFVLESMKKCDLDVNVVFPGDELIGPGPTTTLLVQLGNAAAYGTHNRDVGLASIITWLLDQGARVGVVPGVSELYMPFAMGMPTVLRQMLDMEADVGVFLSNLLDPAPFGWIYPASPPVVFMDALQAKQQREDLLELQQNEILAGRITWDTMIARNYYSYNRSSVADRKACEDIVNAAVAAKRRSK